MLTQNGDSEGQGDSERRLGRSRRPPFTAWGSGAARSPGPAGPPSPARSGWPWSAAPRTELARASFPGLRRSPGPEGPGRRWGHTSLLRFWGFKNKFSGLHTVLPPDGYVTSARWDGLCMCVSRAPLMGGSMDGIFSTCSGSGALHWQPHAGKVAQ
jgi:hypothetical protein